jgi:spore maturation protein CgeB
VKVLILDTYYSGFLQTTYRQITDLASRAYADQLDRLLAQAFGTADFYSRHLCEMGVEAVDVIGNCAPLQLRWADENSAPTGAGARRRGILRRVLGRLRSGHPTLDFAGPAEVEAIVLEQVRAFAPDVLYCQNVSFLSPPALVEAKRSTRLVVGQIASPLPSREFLEAYDLILTSFPHYVPRLRALGVASEYFRIAFEPRVLDRLGPVRRHRPVTFVGGISPAHANGNRLLEALVRRLPLEVFGYGMETLRAESEVRRHHHGEAWGLAMYHVLAESQITINRHIDVAEDNANNMRLYEATGCGALIITDLKKNLGELFRVGEEVVAYRDDEEAVAAVEHYLADPDARERIALAGQRRTLSEHTYERRMQELVQILERALVGRTAA